MLRLFALVVVAVSVDALRLPSSMDSLVPLFSDSPEECAERPLEVIGYPVGLMGL